MDLFATLAGIAALVTWWIHTFLGHRFVYHPLLKAGMHEFPRTVLIVCWHFTTYFLALLVLAIFWAATMPGSVELRTVLGVGAALTLPFSLLFMGVGKWRTGRYWKMPQIYLLGSIAFFQVLALLLPTDFPKNQVVGLVLGLILLVLSLVHILWAQGRTWPAASQDQLTELVVGQPKTQRFPGKGLTWLVAIFLALAALGAASFPHFPNPAKAWIGLMWLLTSAFLVRGVGGFWDYRLRPWTRTLPFGHWNRVLYSPVSVVMGLLALVLVTGAG